MAAKAKTTTKASRKTTVKRKPAVKRIVPKKPIPELAVAQDTGRTMYLAGLGFYGKAYDQAQQQISILQKQLQERRKKADKLYKELVKRGEKLEKNAKSAIHDIELPKLELDNLTDRKKLEQQLKKAKARFNELKQTVGIKAAA